MVNLTSMTFNSTSTTLNSTTATIDITSTTFNLTSITSTLSTFVTDIINVTTAAPQKASPRTPIAKEIVHAVFGAVLTIMNGLLNPIDQIF